MAADAAAFDFLAACRPGMVLRTRDRREARIFAVAPEAGEIRGVVQMMGACAWDANGRYRDAPAGVAGPCDLMPPEPESTARPQQHRESLATALQDPAGNPGCCD